MISTLDVALNLISSGWETDDRCGKIKRYHHTGEDMDGSEQDFFSYKNVSYLVWSEMRTLEDNVREESEYDQIY